MKDLTSHIGLDQSGIIDVTAFNVKLAKWSEKAKPGKYKVVVSEDLTEEQRNYLHAVVFPFIARQLNDMNSTCLTGDDVGDYLKKKFCPEKEYTIVNPKTRKAKTEKRRLSSEDLSKEQYSYLTEMSIRWCMTYCNCEPPPPRVN